MGETTLDRRRLTRANALVLGLLALFAPLFVRAKNDTIVVYNPLKMHQQAVGALPQDELAALAQVASWLTPAGNAKAGAKIADAIRKDPSSFRVVSSFHTDAERTAALAQVPYGKLERQVRHQVRRQLPPAVKSNRAGKIALVCVGVTALAFGLLRK
jgi:hypothetical protein